MLSFRFRHVLAACAIGLLHLLVAPGAKAASAEEAVARCDALASDPHDPGRYAAGVTDEQFAPGAALDACRAAVDTNSDLARSWFQLGRAYWIAERDADAFGAFVQAAKRGYAPAMKFIGDAYSQGRLPPGEQQSPETALAWYKRSKDAGFKGADKAIQDVTSAIASTTFDPSLFQNPSYMKRLYDGNFESIEKPIMFFAYTKAFADELGGTNIFFIDQNCKGMVTALGSLINGLGQLLGTLSALQGENGLMELFGSTIGSSFTHDQGERDAVILMNRYKCDNPITRRIVASVVGSYQKMPTILNATFAGSREDMEKKRLEAARQEVAFAGSMFFPSEARDVSELCPSPPQTEACKAAYGEFRKGSYGALRCGYYNKAIDKTWYYFFWYKELPYNMVALARNNPKAGIRALGTIALQECPKTQGEAEALYQQNKG